MDLIKEISEHKGLAAAAAIGIVAAAKLTFDYLRTLAPKPADKVKPFSDPEMLGIRSDIDRRKAALGIRPRTDRAPQ